MYFAYPSHGYIHTLSVCLPETRPLLIKSKMCFFLFICNIKKLKVTSVKSAYKKNVQNMCYGHSKEPSHGDGSFEHPKHMFKLMD